MNATQELIAKLVAGGMEYAAAAGLVARAAVEMTGALTKKSSGAARQQRYRERNKASLNVTPKDDETVTNRNETSHRYAGSEPSQSVTNRNESVTRDAASLSIEKIESKKVKRESRATALPDSWKPDPKHWAEAIEILGSVERAALELRKFGLHAADKGRLAKNWNAAWVKWCLQAIEYGARNGQSGSNNRTNTSAGRATARETDFLAAVGGGALGHLGKGNAAGSERQISRGFDLAERTPARDEPEGNARAPYRIVG